MRVRYTPRARIDERNPRGAENVKRAIRKTIELIGEYPEGGRTAGSTALASFPLAGIRT